MKQLVTLFLLVAGFSTLACGSSDSGNTGAACAPASFQAQATPACTSCVESKCSSQYQELCAADCKTMTSGSLTTACLSALQDVGECADKNCPVCAPEDGAAGSSSGSAGGTSVGAGMSRACTIGTSDQKICNWYDSSNDLTKAQLDQICSGNMGLSADHCASDGLSGCCIKSGGALCYYAAVDTQSYMDACTQAGGTFTSTPP